MPLLCVPAGTHGSGPDATSVFAAYCVPAARQVGSIAADELGGGALSPTGDAAGESCQFDAPVGGPISAGEAVVGVGIGNGVMCVCCGVGIGSGVAGCGGNSEGM